MIDRLTFAVPGDLDTPTGGYLYDKHIVNGLRDRGFAVDVLDLGDGFPVPTAETRKAAFDLLAGAASQSDAIVVDGLALGVLPECAEMLAGKCMLVALVHHPLYLETGHDPETTERLRRSEHLALSFADFVITTSKLTAEAVETEFSVPSPKIASVEPGFDRPATLPPFREGPHVDILSVGAVVPRKGHAELIEALSGLTALDWTLTIVGALDRDADYARRVSDAIESHALSDRVVLKGTVTSDELDHLFASSDVFALASDHEGFGMAYAEAVLNGLPVIGTTGGAVKTTVPDDAGILIDPGDIPALRKALSDVVSQTGFRRSLAEGARRHRSRYRTWDESADCFADLLKELKMNDFAAEWLNLREKADLPARDQSVRDIVVKYVNGLGKAVIVDLACGTGSMTRSLAGRITVPQKWCLVDNDADLLEEAENHLKERIKPDFEVSTHCLDLNRFPSGIVNLKPNLITTTAFLDLVSVDWLSRLVTFAFMEKVPVYAALTYSGNVEFYPPEPLDGDIVDAMNTHQRGDKGFGPALGPAAADRLTRLFKLSKFETIERASNWNLGDEHKSLQQQYLSGLATAASSAPNLTAQQVGSWLERRQSLVTSGGSRIVVTHKDIAAFPA